VILSLCANVLVIIDKNDAVFRRQIIEPTDVDERNRAIESKRARWDQTDVQINNSEDQWERVVDRPRNRGYVALLN